MCIYRANIIQTILYNYHACLFLLIFTATRNESIITVSTYIYIYIDINMPCYVVPPFYYHENNVTARVSCFLSKKHFEKSIIFLKIIPFDSITHMYLLESLCI